MRLSDISLSEYASASKARKNDIVIHAAQDKIKYNWLFDLTGAIDLECFVLTEHTSKTADGILDLGSSNEVGKKRSKRTTSTT